MDIQTNKGKSSATQEIMRSHAFDSAATQAGMMVPYGQQPPQKGFYAGGGIPGANGFGAGVHG